MKVVLVGVPYINTRIPPLSIALLAGHLRQNDFEVASVDLNIEAYKAAPEDLKKYWKMTQGFQWAEKDIFDAILFQRLVEPNLGGWV